MIYILSIIKIDNRLKQIKNITKLNKNPYYFKIANQ